MAADRGVRVYTVGIGTHGRRDDRRRGMVDARAPRRGVAEDDRQSHARANTSTPGTATDLQKIYKNLNTKLFFEQRETEVTALFAAAAAALALVSGMLSMLWFNRIL